MAKKEGSNSIKIEIPAASGGVLPDGSTFSDFAKIICFCLAKTFAKLLDLCFPFQPAKGGLKGWLHPRRKRRGIQRGEINNTLINTNIRLKHTKKLVLIGFILVFFSVFPNVAKAANLFLSPGSGNFVVGSTFDLSIILDTKDVPVNIIEVELLFPHDKLQLANPSVGKSIIQLWPTAPVFSNQEGRIYFAGAIPSPGVNTSQGVVLTLTFRVISLGEGQIIFGDKTSVLANDGRGTNILNQKPSAFFKFSFPPPQGPSISSPTHPDQEKWHKDNNPVFIWPKIQFSQAYSFEINQDPAGFPDVVAESTDSTASFQNLDNGIWYFHLREKAGEVWGGVSHYVVKIDNQSPASFNINASPSKRTTNQNPIFRFFTTDTFSGFDHFEIKIISLSSGQATDALFFETDSPYQAINLKPGRYQVIVRAIDKAKNTRDEAATINIVSPTSRFLSPEGIDLIFVFAPWFWIILSTGIILFVLLLILLYLWLKHHHHIKHAVREDMQKLSDIFNKKQDQI